MLGTSLALFADLGACHVQKLSVTICVLPAPFRWGATPLLPPISMRWIYFYPRPPSGGRPIQSNMGRRCLHISIHALRVEGDSETNAANSASDAISIHALRVEGDPLIRSAIYSPFRFLSTPSEWRATVQDEHEQRVQYVISIHALRVEGDLPIMPLLPLRWISIHALQVEGDKFEDCEPIYKIISIHALQVEGDRRFF